MNTEYLSSENAHLKDSDIVFDEGPHIYTICGDSKYLSVTTFNHSQFEKFDSSRIIDGMMRSKKWSQSPYYGMSKEEIQQQWAMNGQEASKAGTKMHYDIECYYNGNDVSNDSVEFVYFLNFVRDYPDLVPYRTEWMIYNTEFRLAGSIDMVFKNSDGTYDIYDWKRCKDIQKVNTWGKFSHNSQIEYIPDTNYWHYSLQLNTYQFILEREYGVSIRGLYLVCLHPNKSTYQRIQVPDLQEEVTILCQERKAYLL
jgi:hypothetical protein